MAGVPETHLDQVNAFVLVAKHGSFSAAAAALERDNSIVSRRVHALEKRLGVRLIERTTRRMALTEAGINYLARVDGALDALALADAEASARSALPRGTLKLSLPLAYGRMWVAPVLPAFMAKYPEIRIDARYTDRFVDLIDEGVDLAVRLGTLKDSSLVARRLAGFERRLYAAPAYLKQWGRPRSPADLASHRGLGFSTYERPDRWALSRGAERCDVQVRINLMSDDVASLVTAAEAGAGVVIAADWLVSEHVAAGKLEHVLPEWRVGERSAIYAVTPSARLLPRKTQVLLDWLTDRLSTPAAQKTSNPRSRAR